MGYFRYRRVFRVPEGIFSFFGTRGYFGYQRVFWVPLGGDDGYSSVVLHAAALNHKVAGSIPTPRGGGSSINQ